jgi:hypothetical protein
MSDNYQSFLCAALHDYPLNSLSAIMIEMLQRFIENEHWRI